MYRTDEVLEKLNSKLKRQSAVTLPDIMIRSSPEVTALVGDSLTWGEENFLYQQAQQALKDNTFSEARILSHANPQLAHAVHLAIQQDAGQLGYDQLFGGRASNYVKPGSVASMFSPACYLTELYREGINLHAENAAYRLNTRRPDLATLVLSQRNMDDEVSTLTLSNQLTLDIISKKISKTPEEVRKLLASWRFSSATPFHLPFTTAHHSMLLRDETLALLQRNAGVIKPAGAEAMLRIAAGISPELYSILTETVSATPTPQNFTDNFGTIPIETFRNPVLLARYYELTEEQLTACYTVMRQYNNNFDPLQITTFAMLQLNKLIRFSKATGMAVTDIWRVVASNNNQFNITDAIISQLLRIQYYRRHYAINVSEAWILSGAAISKISEADQPGQFDQLFNRPLLDNQTFSDDNADVELTPGNVTDTFRSGVLKRALQISDSALYLLWALVEGKPSPATFKNTLANLSALYRARLLASIHHLSIIELSALLSISPSWSGRALGSLNTEDLSSLVSFVEQYTRWLQANQLTVSDLFLMTASSSTSTLTPEISNLIATLNGLAGQKLDRDNALTLAAPYIAAAMQLDSADSARAILAWLNGLKPQNLDVLAFLNLVLTNPQTTQLAPYCHVLAQLVLIARALKLSSSELLLAVTQPKMFQSAEVLPHTIVTMRSLARFHYWLQQCQTLASEVLTALSGKTLTPALLAQALGLDEQWAIQALNQVKKDAVTFSSWTEVDETLQWLDIAATLAISPAEVARLLASSAPVPAYDDWKKIATALQTGLNSQQAIQLQHTLDTTSSAAFSACAIQNKTVTPAWVVDRNQLYNYLLIDNQISAQVKTTPLAAAIASVQLYINRALTGQEDGVVNAVRSRNFFQLWDSYNKRYSSWAGVSRLVCYPENYLDPTLRHGQTAMMDEMLQSISQSQLTSDTVEDAFKTYMTRFEQVANLEVVSGYHDNNSINSGTTYLVGKSVTDESYYWRTLNQNLFDAGKYPANAWREWQEITTGMQAKNNLARPVVFNSRLYIVWLEEKEIADADDSNSTSRITSHELKYTFIRHDGTWNIISTVKLSDYFKANDLAKIDVMGMYCSRDETSGSLIVLFYELKAKDDENKSTPAIGLLINTDHFTTLLSNPGAYRTAVWQQFDTTVQKKINQPYILNYSAPATVTLKSVTMETNLLATLSQGRVYNCKIAAGSQDNSLTLTFDCDLRVVFQSVVSKYDITCNILKNLANNNMGDSFYIYEFFALDSGNSSGRRIYPVYHLKQNSMSSGRTLVYREASASGLEVKWPALTPANTFTSSSTALYVALNQDKYPDGDALMNANIFLNDNNKSATVAYGGWKLKTGFAASEIKIRATAGNTRKDFDAKQDIEDKGQALPAQQFSGTIYPFRGLKLDIPLSGFVDGKAEVSFRLTIEMSEYHNVVIAMQTGSLTISQQLDLPPFLIIKGERGEQYLQNGPWRTRINTLFARQLVARANRGLNAVLSMETQYLAEPQLGPGSYVQVDFGRYSSSLHGNGSYQLYYVGGADNIGSGRSLHLCAAGKLSADRTNSLTLFLPYNTAKTGDEKDIIYLGVIYSDANLTSSYTTMQQFKYDANAAKFVADAGNAGRTRGLTTRLFETMDSEPMDFSGANALYFWEMFYYAPMMVFQRLLQEQRYDEATRWIKFIWSPEGYLVNGEPAAYQWNVRPLEEDTTWNTDPLDVIDPDAVAQADPMHYKVATFMRTLDLLIARGDTAYRQLEPDTLQEAKMWYLQALAILGDEPFLTESIRWSNPTLQAAAAQTLQTLAIQAMLTVRQETLPASSASTSSLSTLFLPQLNEKLQDYWRTLDQRLFNLRHHLSIDGQPLSLSHYAAAAEPAALLSAAVTAAQGGAALPPAQMPVYRFPVILERARMLVNQLSQFGGALLSIIERQDAEALAELLQNQGSELARQNIAMQDAVIDEIAAERQMLQQSRAGAQSRFESYATLYEENVNRMEKEVMDLYADSSWFSMGSSTTYTAAAIADALPNIFGLANGGASWGAIPRGVGIGLEITATVKRISAEKVSQSEIYRRRREEWEIQRNNAEAEVKQIDAQLETLVVRREAALLQKTWLETQQAQTQAQLQFLQNKFSNRALYNWLRGKLAAIYYQYYDLSVSCCLMAQESYKWSLNVGDAEASYIKPGAWHGAWAGLLAGETLMLNLLQMEQSYLQREEREKEVVRTACLTALDDKLADKIKALIAADKEDTSGNPALTKDKQLQLALKLADLQIQNDYPDALVGKTRRIKQIGVTLPALVGPYQDIRAVLSYSGGRASLLPRGCNALAVSQGLDDSGQFLLSFNDSRWLPFEGIPVNDTGTFTLSFPDASSKQKDLLLSLSDIILHIRYTIVS
ncbi:neuraminidase-like domain-containing protein [Erwiniaceae bacterium BAC15a-03b]|uniref:Neuraminidase-like domain-containing protein n=1 Tax=Winslowiella arboricola TaxID=2978220 RepID=A0A9J6PZ80_9GAMM|nr:neuraminidase-like domain-containing protein [Winslowiella arboricola]MCU5775375.1 neuraminidase-like domain-containing protein [Winslowiella arboricola]MCU5780228.1 neuraminidase-like domain-containing protein [Winslowiella arboricola]